MSLTNAKIGDVLLLHGGMCNRLDKVIKVTKTQVHGKTGKWRKNGREIGKVGRYDRVNASLATPAEIVAFQDGQRRSELIDLIQDATSRETLHTYTVANLQRILDVLTKG